MAPLIVSRPGLVQKVQRLESTDATFLPPNVYLYALEMYKSVNGDISEGYRI